MEPGVLEDDRCLDVRDFRLSGESAHRDISEVVRVADNDVNQEVVGAGHVVEGDNLGKLLGVLPEASYLGRLVAVESNRNHRLQPYSHNRRVNVGMEAPEHAGVLQPSDAL